MNFSSAFGFLAATIILGVSLWETGMDMMFFLNTHGIVIVCCGTFAAASICFPLSRVFGLFKTFLLRVLGVHKTDFQGTIEQFLELNKKAAIGLSALNDSVAGIKHEFMKEAVSLVAGGVLTEREIRSVLEKRIKTTEGELMYEANMFKVIGRFPPAFGLLGTTLGMIALLQQLGKPGAEKLIGPAMSIGLIATLYGIALANMVFIPIGENLTERTKEEVQLRKMILEGALLLKRKSGPVAIREELNSFLLPKDRVVKKKAA